jgi:hypothetical protein
MKEFDQYIISYYFFLVWGIQLIGYPPLAGFIAIVCAAYLVIQGLFVNVLD